MAFNISENEHHSKGWIITIAIHALLLLGFFLSSMAIPEKEPDKITGIIVNFGNAEAGKKVSNPSTSANQPKESTAKASSSSASSAASEPIIDQKIEEVKAKDAISLSTEKKKKKEKSKEEDKKASDNKPKKDNKKEAETKEDAKPTKTQPVEKKEEKPSVDDRALFTKKENKTDNSKVSEGTSERDIFTDQGKNSDITASQDSKEYSNPYSSELSSNGITANLRGRVLKYIPEVKKRFQTNGKVVIKIKVDQNGKVIQVDQDISKSTTNDPSLVKIALDTAQKALFNQDFGASVRQSGSITFEFKVQ